MNNFLIRSRCKKKQQQEGRDGTSVFFSEFFKKVSGSRATQNQKKFFSSLTSLFKRILDTLKQSRLPNKDGFDSRFSMNGKKTFRARTKKPLRKISICASNKSLPSAILCATYNWLKPGTVIYDSSSLEIQCSVRVSCRRHLPTKTYTKGRPTFPPKTFPRS